MRDGCRCQGLLWPNRLLDAAFNRDYKIEQLQAARFSELDFAYGFVEHSGKIYGQLTVYYRVAGLIPPESRPKK
jgi:hypothetical protein